MNFIPEEEENCNKFKEIADSTKDGLNNFKIGFKFYFSSVKFMFKTCVCKVEIPEGIVVYTISFSYCILMILMLVLMFVSAFVPGLEIIGTLLSLFSRFSTVILVLLFLLITIPLYIICLPVHRKIHLATVGEMEGRKSKMTWNFLKDIPKRVVLKFMCLFFICILIVNLIDFIVRKIPIVGWIIGFRTFYPLIGYVCVYNVYSDLFGGFVFCYKHWKLYLGSALASFIISFVPLLSTFNITIAIISATRILKFAEKNSFNLYPPKINKDFANFNFGKDDPEEESFLEPKTSITTENQDIQENQDDYQENQVNSQENQVNYHTQDNQVSIKDIEDNQVHIKEIEENFQDN